MKIFLDIKIIKKSLYDDVTEIDKLKKIENNDLYEINNIYKGWQGRKLKLIIENNDL